MSIAMFFSEAIYLVPNLMKASQAIGVMSGSSLDGLDLCAATFERGEEWHYKIEAVKTIPFPENIKDRLMSCRNLSGESLMLFDIEFGKWIGSEVRVFIEENKLEPQCIGSHGHTVFHQPEKGLSFQAGNGNAIAIETEIPVVTDFRQQNVLLGGTGAPLVPIGDSLLFDEYDICINLGGIANITLKAKNRVIAGDVVPCNQVLNTLANQMGRPYDNNGEMATRGQMNTSWWERLKSISFFDAPLPRFINNEWVQSQFLEAIPSGNTLDNLHTFTHFIAEQLARLIPENLDQKILLTGGGAHNRYLINLLKTQREDVTFLIPDEQLIESKEALIFAFMALLKMENQPNCLASYTDIEKDISAGVIFFP